MTTDPLRRAAALLLLLLGPPAAAGPPALDPSAALAALGGLAGPLEAEGWTLTPLRGATVEPGDVVDPATQQLQVTGADCFGAGAARRGQGVDATVQRALELGGRGGVGLVRGAASASSGLDLQLSGAEIAELPAAALRPAPGCAEQLGLLAAQGQPVAGFQIVQSVLYADLSVAACVGASAELSAPGAGASARGSACRGLDGARAAIAVKMAPLGPALAAAGVELRPPDTRAPLPAAGRRKKGAALPCWATAPCDPYGEDRYLSATGIGPSMAAADADARARLLGPFERQARALARGGAPAEAARQRLEAAVAVPARHQDGLVYHSLAVIEKGPLLADLDARIRAATDALAAPAAPRALDAAAQRCAAVGAAAERAALMAQRAALRPVGAPTAGAGAGAGLAEAHAACLSAKSAVLIGVPDGAAGELLRARLAARGFTPTRLGDPAAALRVLVTARPSERPVSGLTQVRLEGAVELVGPGASPRSLPVQAVAASSSPATARAQAQRELEIAVASAVSAHLDEVVP